MGSLWETLFTESMKMTYRFSVGTFNMLRGGLGLLRKKRTLNKLEKMNKADRGVFVVREPMTAASIASGLPSGACFLISGNDQVIDSDGSWKNVLAVGFAADALSNGYCPIIIHNGNGDLDGRLSMKFSSDQLLFLKEDNQVYDPLRGYSIEECVSLLMRNGMEKFASNEPGQRYLEGIVQIFEWGYGKRPYLKAINEILAKDHGFIAELAQSALNNNRINEDQYTAIIR